MNISVVATFIAKLGDEANIQTLAMQAIAPTLKENGCLKYALHINKDNSREFVFIEEWKSQEDLDLHLKTKHVQVLFNSIQPYIESSDIKIYKPL